MVRNFTQDTKDLIDNLKSTCASYGLGNDGNESKIITQVFLYKFMNDKFGYDLKNIDERFSKGGSWEKIAAEMSDESFNKIVLRLSPNTAKLKKDHLLSNLYNKQNTKNFSKLFDSTLVDISQHNAGIFSVSTASNAKIVLFDELSQFVSDPSRRDDFCKAVINQLVNFSFEEIFIQKFDFFSTIFEYLIKDYNKDGGGKYAEYYTPHAVSKIMAKILVDKPVKNATVYDPSAGSGTLLMNVAHEIGEKNCSIFSQDISQKSSGMLRLNLILNDLVHSIPNVIQGNTLREPGHREGKKLKKFDFIVSNPPFKLDFSDFRDELDIPENKERFFSGIPTIPKKKKETMPIYLLFLQHIISSLSDNGKAAIVVPTGFLTNVEKTSSGIRRKLVEDGILKGAISMPSNIFATTGTSISIIFVDKSSKTDKFLFVDATKLGTPIREGKNQKTILSTEEEDSIVGSFSGNIQKKDFSVLVSKDDVIKSKYSFNPGDYFETLTAFGQIDSKDMKAYLGDLSSELDNRFTQTLDQFVREIEEKYVEYFFFDFNFPDAKGNPYKESGGKMKFDKELNREIPVDWVVRNLSDLLPVLTGKKDANYSTPDGAYNFFTCAEEVSKCPTFEFDGKAILVAGNGSFNIKTYEGKFNAYQRTYVLIPRNRDLFTICHLAVAERILKLTKGSRGSIVKFITKGNLEDIKIALPNDSGIALMKLVHSATKKHQEKLQKSIIRK